jgi:hypothetical protein
LVREYDFRFDFADTKGLAARSGSPENFPVLALDQEPCVPVSLTGQTPKNNDAV